MASKTYSSSAASLQHPLPSGFTAYSTADDVIKGIDLTGKNIIVTGAYSGIGLETARVLAAAGARIFAPARDLQRAQAALKPLSGHIEIDYLDLADPKSIDTYVQGFLAKNLPLHVLVNNAGIGHGQHELDARGFEKQFAINHLGTFQLTNGLLPALRAAHGARVVTVSSLFHQVAHVNWDDIHFKQTPYSFVGVYGQSKTLNALFSFELDKREKQNGVRSFAVHPGLIVTNIAGSDLSFWKGWGMVDEQGNKVINPDIGFKTPEQGAATQVFASVSPLLANLGGLYLENNDVAALTHPDPSDPTKFGPGVHLHAIDDDEAKKLWELSERLLASKL